MSGSHNHTYATRVANLASYVFAGSRGNQEVHEHVYGMSSVDVLTKRTGVDRGGWVTSLRAVGRIEAAHVIVLAVGGPS